METTREDRSLLTLALAKGRLFEEARGLLAGAGLPVADLAEDRRLLIERPEAGLRFLLARPADVATYVREGAADLGMTGKDVLLENPGGLYELLDLRVGPCRLMVAGPMEAGEWEAFMSRKGDRLRVATKFPRVAREYFTGRGLEPAVIALGGALELAPRVGMADVIVDLVATGGTLRANGLHELAEIAPVTARLIANPVSLRLRSERIEGLVAAVREALRASGGARHANR